MNFKIDEIWVESDALEAPLTEKVIGRLPHAKVVVGSDIIKKKAELLLSKDPISRGKRILKLLQHKGAFLKKCPGTNEYVCCGLEILHTGQGCPMDCRYCALQAYFNRPTLEMFINTDEMIESFKTALTDQQRFRRICTGEFTDSLALDPLSGLSALLLDTFSGIQNVSLEFKTKTDFIEPLLNFRPMGNIVLGFSMNAPQITLTEELKTASLKRRLEKAKLASEHGYKLGFHFDPIIPLGDWRTAYKQTVDSIFRSVDSESIAWISMGVLRFTPDLKEIATQRFGAINYFHDGFARGLDGKSRLEVDRRISIYRYIATQIRSHFKDARIYLCMESPHVWEEALDTRMETDEQLADYLSAAFRS